MNYIIITKKKWNKKHFLKLSKKIIILKKIDIKKIIKINPKVIFFIHWSKIIPKSLFQNYICIQFHVSDLPKGRGGSPIQNQILNNIKETKITAFKINEKLDSGPICMKKNFSLEGNAKTILKNMEITSINMIKKLVKKKTIKFKEQYGKPTFFKRRMATQSEVNISKVKTLDDMYNFLRMLDAPGYPNAFINLKNFKLTFNQISIKNKIIHGKVKIEKNEK